MRRVILETDDGQRIIFGKEDIFWQSMEGRSFCLTYEDFTKVLTEYREKVMGKGNWPGVADPYREIGMDQPVLTKFRRHGIDCPKKVHRGTGALHGPDDDTPYDVDGVKYCGRCHFVL